MFKVYTTNTDLAPSKLYTTCQKDELLNFLQTADTLCIDTETTGFDPHQEKMLCIQLGNKDEQYVIDTRSLNVLFLKPFLENALLIGQNLKFDLKFLYKQGIHPRKIYDTFVAEKVLNCGDNLVRAGLDALAERYCGVTLDKTIRTNIKKEGLSEQVLQYAADDIKYLEEIRDKQLVALREKDLIGALNIENKFTPALAYIEYCGFKLDRNKWRLKMEKDQERLEDCLTKLNDWVMSNQLTEFIDSQMDMFQAVGCSVNWSSSMQVIHLFESLGIDCTVVDKGVAKKSVEASVIGKNSHELVKLYLAYKRAEKVTSTYGKNFLAQINPVTQRLHTNFRQILDTGRISSGGKDKNTGEAYINFQNIPSDAETRSCFVAEPGNTLIISDYSGQEQIVLANRAQDDNLLAFYDNGLADMHSFVASKMYPELVGLTLDEVKDKHKSKRQAAKSAGFAINYGGQGITIADNLGIPLEEGNKIYDAYFLAFPGLRRYFDTVKQSGLDSGYILINDVTRRKSFLPFFPEYKRLEQEMDKKFWTRYREAKAKQSYDYPELKDKVSKYFMYKGDIERKSLNFPIQGTSAEITKISCVYIFNYIIENNLFGAVKFVNTVHDENVLECPLEMQDEIAKMVEEAMCKAGEIFCKRVPLKAEPELSTYWKK